MIELRNGRMKMGVDPQRGSILRIEDMTTGLVHLDATKDGRSDGRLFRCILPTEMWWSCYADSQEQPSVRCERSGNGLTLEYPDLLAVDGTQTGVSAKVQIGPGNIADEFLLTMQVENRGKRTVLDVTFPLLGGWHEHGADSRITAGGNNSFVPRALSAPLHYGRIGQRDQRTYPVGLACPWLDFSTRQGGLSYLNYMTQGRNGDFWLENLAGYSDDFRLMFGWCYHVAIRPGESWSSPAIGLAVHDGDWRNTAERYRLWFDRQHPPDYSRPGIRSRIGYQNIFFRGFDGTPFRPFEEIPQVAAAARRYGVDMLCVWDTLSLGNYSRANPYDLTDYPPADREKLRQGLRQAEKEGTKTCALINFRHPNVALHLSDPDIGNRVQRRYTGTFTTENFAGNHTYGHIQSKHIGPESYVFSPFSTAHRERVMRLTEEYLDLGYSSMFYDQPFEMMPDYGFLDRGCSPDATHHEALQIVREVKRRLLLRDPQAVLIGEMWDIHATPFIDQFMNWGTAEPTDAVVEQALMLRYSLPHTIMSWTVDHELDRASMAFAMGFQLNLMVHGAEATLADEPGFAEHVRALAGLRKRTAERTVMARFRGKDGLTIDADSGFTAYAYESPAGIAVAVTAGKAAARGRVTVNSELFPGRGISPAGTVFSLDGATAIPAGKTCEFNLGKHDVAMWYL